MKKELKVNKELYPLKVAMKAAYNFIEEAYIFFKSYDEENYTIEFESKTQKDINDIFKEFKNELLHESIREKVGEESKNIREIILSRALYGLALENTDTDFENKNDLKILEIEKEEFKESYESDSENIGESWFKK